VHASGGDGSLRRRRANFIPLDPGAAGSPVLVLCETADCDDEAHAASDGFASSTVSRDDDAMRLHERIAHFRHKERQRHSLDRLIGDSPAMQLARAQVRTATASRSNVVVVGAGGSGRQWVARTIHYGARDNASAPADEPLVTLDGAVLTDELLSSAAAALASRGRNAPATILIVNLDKLPQEIQPDLIRLCVRFAGLRLLATSQLAPEVLVAEGRLHPYLAAAAGTLVVRLPPLCDRRHDIPILAQLFVEELNAEGGKQIRGLASDAVDELVGYSWPGNMDELAGFLREAFQRAKGVEITVADLPRRLAHAAVAARLPRPIAEPIVLEEFLAGIERELIERALKQARGNKAHAARLLGLTRPRLYRRMVQLGLETEPAAAPGVADGQAVAENGGKTQQQKVRKPIAAKSSEAERDAVITNEDAAEFIEDIPFEEQAEP
jgi:DNA-binding NtrC family response regulator